MAKPSARITLLEFGFALVVAVIVARAGWLQLRESREAEEWLDGIAADTLVTPAKRGAILDRNGAPLAITNVYYHIGVAPNELRDTARAVRALAKALDEAPARLRARIAAGRYLYWHGPFDATTVERLRGIRGIHLDDLQRRAYPARDLALPIVGRLKPDSSTGASGIERSLDSLLAGTPGLQVMLKARGMERLESPRRRIREPAHGHDVVLTIDANLQEIAEHVLDSTVRAFRADGGDVVMMDVRNGELLAAAGVARNDATGETMPVPSFVTVPFEPGSTAKLLTAAALLESGRVGPTDAVPGRGGRWLMQAPGMRRPRTIIDEHEMDGPVTLDTAIKYSSNIAMAQFAAKLSPAEQFEYLRGFGLGTQTGVEATGEDRGYLSLPARWTAESPASHAMGYEFRVTAVQMAVAYAAIANGGVVLAPALVREIRAPGQTTAAPREPEPVRRVMSPKTAATLVKYLSLVTERGGTGVKAGMRTYSIAGKTGTATKFDPGCRCYNPSKNIASFAAVFPAEDPQLAIVLKVDTPREGRGFGGGTSAPAVRAILEQMLASESAPVDRTSMRRVGGPPSVALELPPAAPTMRAEPPVQSVALPLKPVALRPQASVVPDVAGKDVRAAVATLFKAGFRVAARPGGRVVGTQPSAGTSVRPGTLVSLRTE